MNKKLSRISMLLSVFMVFSCISTSRIAYAVETSSTNGEVEYLPDDPDPNAGYDSAIKVDKNSTNNISVSSLSTSLTKVAGTYVWPNNDVTMILYSGITVYSLTYTTSGQFYMASKRGYGFTNYSTPDITSVKICGANDKGLRIIGTFPNYGQTEWYLNSSTSTSFTVNNFGSIGYTADSTCEPKTLFTIPKGYTSYYQVKCNNDKIVTFVLANSSCYNYCRGKWQAFTVDGTEKVFRPYINSYNVTFKYRTVDGANTTFSKNSSNYLDTSTIQPDVPEDKLNYMSFKQWDRKPGEVYRNTTYNAIYEEASDSFWEDGLRYGILEGNNVTLISCGDKTDVNIPAKLNHNGTSYNVVKLQSVAFKNNENITSVKIPEGVSSIPDEEFLNCKSLNTVYLPESLKTIGNRSFKNTVIKEINIPDKVESIGEEAFKSTLLESIELPSELKTLGTASFQIDSLKKVILNSEIVPVKNTFSNNLEALRVKDNFNAALQANLPGSYLEVMFQDSKDFNFTTFSKWYVKSGSSAEGLQAQPSHLGYIFKNWGASLNNVTESMRYEAVYEVDPNKDNNDKKDDGETSGSDTPIDTEEKTELKNIQVTLNKEVADNREQGIFAIIDNMELDVTYYYTLDGSTPDTTSQVTSDGVVNITAPNTDDKENVILKVIGYKNGKAATTIATKVITFNKKTEEEVKKVALPKITLNKTVAENRDDNVFCIISDKEDGAEYYYTLDGSIPTQLNGTRVTTNAINIPAPDIDTEKTMVLSVVGFKDGEKNSDSVCEFITFKAKEIVEKPTDTDKDNTSNDTKNTDNFNSVVGKVEEAMNNYTPSNLANKTSVQLKAFNAIPISDKLKYTVSIEDFEKVKSTNDADGSVSYKVVIKDKNGNEKVLDYTKVISAK